MTSTMRAAIAAVGFALAAPVALAQGSAIEEIEKYRQALQDGNPAELWVARGEDLWRKPAGPKKVSLEKCDLGLGPGVVKGAYAQLPRHFADADRVMDLETRLVWCRVNLQGMTEAEAKRNPFGGPGVKSDLEALTAWITFESMGVKMAVSLDHPKMREAYDIGKAIFFFRGGPYDFACATCHAEDGKRIRLQGLPNFSKPGQPARETMASWPTYRVSQGALRTMQHRLWDCYRQQRWPVPEYGSDGLTALTVFLQKQAAGGEINVPSIKR